MHDHISEYVIRTQPNSKSLCTVEAIALSLSILEKNEEIAEVRHDVLITSLFYDQSTCLIVVLLLLLCYYYCCAIKLM